MNFNERIDIFLKLQDEGKQIDEIASNLGIKSTTLRRELNKNGYKSVKGKYIKVDKSSENQQKEIKDKKKLAKKDTASSQIKIEEPKVTRKTTSNKNKVVKPKRDKKINITAEDLDKLCEVYDWYLEVKDLKSLKRKKSKKEVNIDFPFTEYKNTSIKVDKKIWEDFLRLCSNTNYDKKELLSQALNDFMKTYKDLI